MNREWSERNSTMQRLLGKQTLGEGIGTLLSLREELMGEMLSWRGLLTEEEFSKMPFPNAKGYHSKTAAYSLWHVFRIEDIVLHSLILKDEEILFREGFLEKTGSPIITTGNELTGEAIAAFSRGLRLNALYDYIASVKASTDDWLETVDFAMLSRRFTEEDKARLTAKGVVSSDPNAAWLVDYWCGKDVKGLLKMPFSRHWIMHTEAGMRILRKLKGIKEPEEKNEEKR